MIALASDHVGIFLKQEIMAHLDDLGIPYKDYGTYDETRCNYPEYAYRAACAVANGECEKGILCCGTGVGISIAANKVHGIRCVCCSEPYSALLSRQHNDTNMLAMGARVVGRDLAMMIVDQWLSGVYEGGRHQIRLEEIAKIEKTQKLCSPELKNISLTRNKNQWLAAESNLFGVRRFRLLK